MWRQLAEELDSHVTRALDIGLSGILRRFKSYNLSAASELAQSSNMLSQLTQLKIRGCYIVGR